MESTCEERSLSSSVPARGVESSRTDEQFTSIVEALHVKLDG